MDALKKDVSITMSQAWNKAQVCDTFKIKQETDSRSGDRV